MLKLVAIVLCCPLVALFGQSSASAEALNMTLLLSGAGYDGPPEFALLADGAVVGKGGVGASSDGDQQFFDLTVEDGDAVETLSVEFTNDLSVEGKGDRNLVVHSVTVNGTTFPGADLVPAASVLSEVQGSAIAIYTSGAVDLKRPPSGWPVAAACETGNLAVLNFANGNSELVESEQKRVLEFVKNAGDGCRYTVTGYSSMAGPKWTNDLVSMKRAQTVAAVLLAAGLDKDRVATVAGGPTNQFGLSPAKNRRVVVQAAP